MPKQIDFKPRRTPSKKTSAKRAVSPRKTVKTAQTASKTAKTAKTAKPTPKTTTKTTTKATSTTSIKINFGPKKATVKRKTISIVEASETPEVPETPEMPEVPEATGASGAPEIPKTPEQLVAEADLIPDTERTSDLDLEEVFDELETEQNTAANQNLFDDFENPIDVRQENFIAEPEPLELDTIEKTAEQEPLDDFANISAEEIKAPTPPPRRNSPFLEAVKVEKRPLSGGSYHASRTAVAQFTAAPEENSNPLVENVSAKKHPEKETPTTIIDAAPKKGSGTLGLLMAILATVIAGGFVGAMIYFMFFQE